VRSLLIQNSRAVRSLSGSLSPDPRLSESGLVVMAYLPLKNTGAEVFLVSSSTARTTRP
jgi:hypothetical protein